MTYDQNKLLAAYTAANNGVAPAGADLTQFNTVLSQSQAGLLTDDGVLAYLINTAQDDVQVAAQAYQFFTGKTPSKAGLDFLTNSSANATDLNDPYYAQFSIENRYINFAANLGLQGEGAAAFASAYGAMSFSNFVTTAYELVIGSGYATAAGINVANAVADIVSRQQNFVQIARDRQLINANSTQAQIDIATKAAVIGYLMVEGVKADVGAYAAGANNFVYALINGTAQYNVDMLATYSTLGGGKGSPLPATGAELGTVTVFHNPAGGNGVANTVTVSGSGITTATLVLKDGTNVDPRFNLTFNTTGATSVTITDSDTQSNTVRLSTSALTGALTVSGGRAADFLNLDAAATGVGAAGQLGAFLKDASGLAVDGAGVADFGNQAAAPFIGTKLDGSAYLGSLILRVGDSAATGGAQSLTFGSGADTVIFDARSGANAATAGLSAADTVAGGAGADTLALDGDGTAIVITGAEWANVTGFETLRLIGNGVAANNAAGAVNAYNITLTNAFVAQNGASIAGGGLRVAVINDNDPGNDAALAAATPNNAASSAESGVTIDARGLTANRSFSYNGEEGSSATADRFIVGDAGLTSAVLIDGGRATQDKGSAANADVLEIRNGATVTLSDLSGVSNVGTLQFTNDAAGGQSSTLQLDNDTIDRMVNNSSLAVSGADEILAIQAVDNGTVASRVSIDASTLSGFHGINFTGSNLASDLVVLAANAGGSVDTIDLGGGTSDRINWVGAISTGVFTFGASGSAVLGGAAGSTTHVVKNVETFDMTQITRGSAQFLFAEGGGTVATSGSFAWTNEVIGFDAATDQVRASGASSGIVLNGAPVTQAAGTAFTSVATGAFNANGTIGGAVITGAVAGNLLSETDVATAIGAIANETIGEEAYFVVTSTGLGGAGLYHWVSIAADNKVTAGELELLGVVNLQAAASPANFLFY